MNKLSYSGFQQDEASSACQKSVRRGLELESIQWTLEIFWIGGGSRTNIWNRILVMSVEDVGPANPSVLLHVYHLFKNNFDDEVSIVTAVLLVCQSVKSRVNDWGIICNHNVNIELTDVFELQKCLIENLKTFNYINCLFLVNKLHFSDIKLSGYKYKNSIWLIWETFKSLNDQYINTVIELGMSKNWRWSDKARLLYSHAIHLWCYYGGTIDVKVRIESYVLQPMKELSPLIENCRNRIDLFEVPDYAVDKHTARGKRMGRGLAHFLNEGSKLNNEDTNWSQLSNYYLSLLIKNER